jgi:hypothetical protein
VKLFCAVLVFSLGERQSFGSVVVAATSLSLEQIHIAKPCPASWAEMAGDERVRFCAHCSLHVYNLSALSRQQAEDLIAEREGRVCVRLYRRQDGTVLTQDCPVGLRAWRRRLAWIGAIAAGLLVAVIGITAAVLGSAAPGRHQNGNLATGVIQKIKDRLFPAPPPVVMGKMAPPVPLAPAAPPEPEAPQ